MKLIKLFVFGSIALLNVAHAQQSAISSFEITNSDSNSSDGYGLQFQILIPAAFPKPEKQVFVKVLCTEKVDASSDDPAVFQATQKPTITETTFAFGKFKATCVQGKLTVQHPNLFSLLVPKISNVSDLGDATQYGRDAKGFAITKNRMMFALAMGSVDSTTFNRTGNVLKVVANNGNIAVSVSQGKAPTPLRLGEKNYAPFKINPQQPFSLHLLEGNDPWQNVTINFAASSLSFWQSREANGAPIVP